MDTTEALLHIYNMFKFSYKYIHTAAVKENLATNRKKTAQGSSELAPGILPTPHPISDGQSTFVDMMCFGSCTHAHMTLFNGVYQITVNFEPFHETSSGYIVETLP